MASVEVCPAETSMMSAPFSLSILATSTASSPVRPPSSTQSVAEMRTATGFPAGHAARTARSTSSGNFIRFPSGPPYSSVRTLESGEMKLDSK